VPKRGRGSQKWYGNSGKWEGDGSRERKKGRRLKGATAKKHRSTEKGGTPPAKRLKKRRRNRGPKRGGPYAAGAGQRATTSGVRQTGKGRQIAALPFEIPSSSKAYQKITKP